MKTAIILHGMPDTQEEYLDPANPGESNNHWLPWLQQQLIRKGILAQTPELPEPYAPEYEKWCSVFEQFKIDQDTMLIAYSCGAGFLVRWLGENKVKTGKVALVAPFLDPDHDEVPSGMLDFSIDPTLVERTAGLCIFVSLDDDQEILTSVKQLRNAWPQAEVKELTGRRHFTFEDTQTHEFPELLAWLVAS